jgi:cytochrome c-type biogenesis protein CcsB
MILRLTIVVACLSMTLMAASAQDVRQDFDYTLLESVAVQDEGFEKTLLTFASERARIITGKARFEGQHPIGLVLGMAFEPQAWSGQRLLKVDHPQLVELFELKRKNAKRIMIDEMSEPRYGARLEQFYNSSQAVGKATRSLNFQAQTFLELEAELAIIPLPLEQGDWLSPAASRDALSSEQQQIATAYDLLRAAYLSGDAAEFAKAAEELVAANAAELERQGVDVFRLKVDGWSTYLRPYKISYLIYLLATLMLLAVLVFKRPVLFWPGLALLAVGLAMHSVGLIMRTILVGRAPLSNLYESLVFAVAGVIVVTLIMALSYRKRAFSLAVLGSFSGALLGFLFLVLAEKMPVHRSQIAPIMPALQSPWLTYHVITIMLSYSAFALSFLISLFFLAFFLIGRQRPDAPAPVDLNKLDFFNYRIIAIGFPLLTIGIITGAVWAATAWGRPWGFDPKETWSAITWIIYGVYLHARFLTHGPKRRLWSAILSIIGFGAVLFTYLGVNFLLAGLHSYAGG